jgi:phosphopantothenoylcysteine decarboxylase/phosphopantothenate--cysteine ligase
MAAAVADFTPERPRAGKLKKADVGERLELRLARTPDVLSGLAAQRRPGQRIIGFAAEHGDHARAYGRAKLEDKGLDAIVVNDVGAPGVGFETPDNEVWIVTAEGERHVPRATKAAVAAAVLDAVLSPGSQSTDKVPR